MKTIKQFICLFSLVLLMMAGSNSLVYSQANDKPKDTNLDKQVKAFLKERENSWRDLNVPTSDGQALYDIIVKNNYKQAVEIGTSTGHSGIWIAWALSKTGGKLTTFEIDEDRHKEAMENFKKAGLSQFIDARLGDAHELVPQVKGPVDFVFSDADKSWYINYFNDLDSKLSVGGCFVSHNVSKTNNQRFYEYVIKLPNYKTTLDDRGAGMSISYKTGK
ncbi:MAG TPA: class I SAM-dependent methyltransferase [Prolixibacteraceae bacterium]|nr:class I SAM-dependent methyltransferase [Prolixibacteraceae bacterium]